MFPHILYSLRKGYLLEVYFQNYQIPTIGNKNQIFRLYAGQTWSPHLRIQRKVLNIIYLI